MAMRLPPKKMYSAVVAPAALVSAGVWAPAPVAVVCVAGAVDGFQLTLAIPNIVGIDGVAGGVASGVVGKAGEMVVTIGGMTEATFLGAAGVIRVRSGRDGLEVGPSVECIGLSPTVSRRGSVSGSRKRACNSIERIVGKR